MKLLLLLVCLLVAAAQVKSQNNTKAEQLAIRTKFYKRAYDYRKNCQGKYLKGIFESKECYNIYKEELKCSSKQPTPFTSRALCALFRSVFSRNYRYAERAYRMLESYLNKTRKANAPRIINNLNHRFDRAFRTVTPRNLNKGVKQDKASRKENGKGGDGKKKGEVVVKQDKANRKENGKGGDGKKAGEVVVYCKGLNNQKEVQCRT